MSRSSHALETTPRHTGAEDGPGFTFAAKRRQHIGQPRYSAGRELGDLHVNYEAAEPYPAVVEQGDLRLATITDPKAFFRVTKMHFGGTGRAKDKSVIIYNSNITVTGIPPEA